MKFSLAKLLLLAMVFVIGAGLVSSVQAQDVANGQATATILAALTITADSAIRFGDVLQGVPRTVSDASNDSSGVFRIAGQTGSQISFSIMLPTYLSHTTNAQDRMDIYFTDTDGAYNLTASAQPETAAPVDFNPHAGQLVTMTNGECNVFLGGTVVPKPDQTPGAYSGDIVVSVIYGGG
jgi:hypothetical protein